MTKRLFDSVMATIGLVLLLPLLAVIALAVKLDSAGPVLFSQVRVGQRGDLFTLRKFRSMYATDVKGPGVTASDDPRVTRVGRVLRRFKLDELPQLFNVLLGDMSLVGPRPEVPEFMAYYPVESREKILSVRPGITDFAAIEFRDEESMLEGVQDKHEFYIREILPKKIELYERYVANQSLILDIQLIMRTITALLGRRADKQDDIAR